MSVKFCNIWMKTYRWFMVFQILKYIDWQTSKLTIGCSAANACHKSLDVLKRFQLCRTYSSFCYDFLWIFAKIHQEYFLLPVGGAMTINPSWYACFFRPGHSSNMWSLTKIGPCTVELQTIFCFMGKRHITTDTTFNESKKASQFSIAKLESDVRRLNIAYSAMRHLGPDWLSGLQAVILN